MSLVGKGSGKVARSKFGYYLLRCVKNVKFHPLLIQVNSQLTDHLPNNLDLKQYIVKTVYAYTYSLCTDVPPPSDFFLREGRRLYTGATTPTVGSIYIDPPILNSHSDRLFCIPMGSSTTDYKRGYPYSQ